MKSIVVATAIAAGLVSAGLGIPAAHAQGSDTARVGVAIRIPPMAFLEFPSGTSFSLRVPDWGYDKGHGHDSRKGHDKDDDRDHWGRNDGKDHGRDDDRDHDRDRGKRHGRDDDAWGRSDRKHGKDPGRHDDNDRSKGNDGDRGKSRAKDNDWNRWNAGYDIRDHDDDRGREHGRYGGRGGDHYRDNDYSSGYVFIKPVLIPFRVRGNTWAAVSARPSEYLRIKAGRWLGLATLDDDGDRHRNSYGKGHDKKRGKGHRGDGEDELGYNIIVQYPMPTWLHALLYGWDGFGEIIRKGFAVLTGEYGAWTPPLNADASHKSSGAYGMIYIVTGNRWTESGEAAKPGYYSGSIQLSVTTDEN